MLSIAKENSFEESTQTIKNNENNFERPSILSKYDMSQEMLFNKIRNNTFNEEFDNISEKSSQHDMINNLQNNMKLFQRYHIGRNQNMKETQSWMVVDM